MRSFMMTAFVAVIFGLFSPQAARGGEPESAEAWLTWFAARWNDESWEAGRRRGYMRSLDDEGWLARVLAMQGIVAAGKDSVAPLVKALKSDHTPTRLLAAQTLGYLAPHVPREPLVESLESDADAAVRLYAVDSLGMQGGADLSEILTLRRESEKNRDTRKHIGYALERGKQPVDQDIIETLVKWDSRQINSAKVGEAAPDFQLTTVSGVKYRLSDFRGKKPVVLVFIYGDT